MTAVATTARDRARLIREGLSAVRVIAAEHNPEYHGTAPLDVTEYA